MVRRNLRSDFVGRCLRVPRRGRRPARRRGGGGGTECRPERRRGQRAPRRGVRRAGLLGGRRARDLRGGRPAAGPARTVGPTSWPVIPRRRRVSPPPGPAVNAGTRRFLDLCRDERLQLGGRRHPLLRPLDHARAVPRGATTPGSSWRPRRPVRSRRTTRARPSPRCGSRRTTRWPATGPARSRSSSRPSATSRPSGASPPAPRSSRRRRHASSAVPTIEPRVVPDGNGMRIVLPGRPGLRAGPGPRPHRRRGPGRLQRGGARRVDAGERGGSRRRARRAHGPAGP